MNIEDNDLREPLHFAVQRRSKALVSLLVEKGARANHRDRNGQTALYGAISEVPWRNSVVRKEELEMTAYLLENGAEYEVKDKWGQTPLLRAAVCMNLSIAELLIKRGANINIRDCKDRNPLSCAIYVYSDPADQVEQKNLISLLINHGAHIDSIDGLGRTPLSYAVEYEHYDDNEVVALLIQKGAQIETKCNSHMLQNFAQHQGSNIWSRTELMSMLATGRAIPH